VEASGLRVSQDDFGTHAQGGGVFDELVLEALVDPGLGYRGVGGLGLVEDTDAGVVLGDRCGADDDGEQQSEGVGGDYLEPGIGCSARLPLGL